MKRTEQAIYRGADREGKLTDALGLNPKDSNLPRSIEVLGSTQGKPLRKSGASGLYRVSPQTLQRSQALAPIDHHATIGVVGGRNDQDGALLASASQRSAHVVVPPDAFAP